MIPVNISHLTPEYLTPDHDIAELHRTYVSSVERGERDITVDSLERLADALGVDVRVFFEPE